MYDKESPIIFQNRRWLSISRKALTFDGSTTKKAMKPGYDVIVIGGGAAGMIAAGRAAGLGASVLLIEKMNQPGRKLLITGKGRCNISNDAPPSVYYKNIFPNGRYLKHAFASFFSADIVRLLGENGVPTTVERGNRIFPTSNSAKDVHAAILNWLKGKKADILLNASAQELILDGNVLKGVRVKLGTTVKDFICTSLILCTGGKSYPATGSTGDGYRMAQEAGHSLINPRPSLVPLVTQGDIAQQLQGLSLKNSNAVLWVNQRKHSEEFGELLFTHFGLSGPVILTLSRIAVDELDKGSQVQISIDLKPALDEQKLDARLLRDINSNGKKLLANLFREWLPSKMIPVFFSVLKLDAQKEAHQLTAAERKAILRLMKNFQFDITGYRGFAEAVVTSGGIDTQEVDNKTMESKLVRGLYFAGEILNLDGNTGGFNLQIAYSTAWLAAGSCLHS
ncbi:MAG: NAD(P)/FAD-dependent oxidoreductase [Bacteroidales bacterium]|nr:NAD(P)/FAD-dependent oxidoreductase [Bacteroidales bacterium]